jgi:hypothetical protein
MPIIAHGYLLVILLWSLYVDSLLFCKSWHNGVHNCSNTCLYALWSILILILMHSMCTKFVELFANCEAPYRFDLKTCCDSFLKFDLKTGGDGFSRFGLKIGGRFLGLVIWVSKSPRRFFGLRLKTMWASVCRLHHKTDRVRSTHDTRQDLAAFFVWK